MSSNFELHCDARNSDQTCLPGFGARLRRLRRAFNLKQAYVAQLAGVTQATVSRWESGSITPDPSHAHSILQSLGPEHTEDSALKRLVESSSLVVHLVTDVDHVLLAASKAREAEWGLPVASVLGKSVWKAASPAIHAAEINLESTGWWACAQPTPVEVELDAYHGGFLPIAPGRMLWERLWLSDGRPARLCTLVPRARQNIA